MAPQTSLSPAEIQARLHQGHELMARVHQSNQQAADQLAMLGSQWAGNLHNQHQGKMAQILEDLQSATNQYQQLLDHVESGNAKFQQYDA